MHTLLHPNCHHQIVFSKLNLKIEYPPLYERLVWNYKNADSQSINKVIEMFNPEKSFQTKNIHDQLKLFNETIVNIVSNYIPNKFIICNDKDPPWLNGHIKRLINLKSEIFKKYLKDGRPDSVYENLQIITWDLPEAVSCSKKFYYKRLAKAYWSIIKTLFNGKKVPVIPPILVNNKLVTNFKDKANVFNDFFSKQCQPIPNNSTLPSVQSFELSNSLSTVDIDSKKILKLIQRLNSSKAHGHDGISIRMPKIFGLSVITPLSLLFNNCLRDGAFPNNWKKTNVVPVHKKGNKQLVSKIDI